MSPVIKGGPELSANWTENTILHHSLTEGKNLSIQAKGAENKDQEKRFIKRRTCEVKAEKIPAVVTKGQFGARGQGEPGVAVAATAEVMLTQSYSPEGSRHRCQQMSESAARTWRCEPSKH